MRILYFHQYFKTRGEAGGTRSFEMARRLVSAGHEVHVITADRSGRAENGDAWWCSEEGGIQVHWTPVRYNNVMPYSDRIRAFLRYSWLAGRRGVGIPADVAFATSTPLTVAIPATFAARRQRIPMVFEVRDLWPELPIAVGALRGRVPIAMAQWLERMAYRNAAQLVALSPGMRDGMVRAGADPSRIEVIPNSCDVDLFDVGCQPGRRFRERYPWLGDRPLVVYTGTLGRINGVTYLARVAAHMANIDASVRFLVLGSGAEEERIRQEAHRLGVLNRSFFMAQRVAKVDMPEVLSAADVATSLFVDVKPMWHNAANKFFDALAARRPVMINYGGWQAEILESTGAGVVVPADEPGAAASALHSLLKNEERMARARAAAGELAQNRFHRDLLAEKLMRVLERAVGHTTRESAHST